MDTIFLILIICGAVFVLCAIFSAATGKWRNKNDEFIKSILPSLEGCKTYSHGKGFHEMMRYCIDLKTKTIHIFYGQPLALELSEHKARNIKDITKCELLINNKSIHSTNRGSQLLGAAVGGIVLGGVGAIVGGLSGSKSSKKGAVIDAKIEIYFNTPDAPLEVLLFRKNDYESLNDLEKCATEFYATILACMSSEAASGSDVRLCPFCAEEIKSAARVCKHCGRDVEPVKMPEPQDEAKIETRRNVQANFTDCPLCKKPVPTGDKICPACFAHMPEV